VLRDCAWRRRLRRRTAPAPDIRRAASAAGSPVPSDRKPVPRTATRWARSESARSGTSILLPAGRRYHPCPAKPCV